MPQVTCPRCGTRQPLEEGADGYTCTSCGASWMFAACENCGVRFHMRPGTTDWTCPECGHEHGSATMGEFEPEPATSEEPATAPAPSHARPTAAPSTGRRPPSRARLAIIAVVGIVAVVAIAIGLSSLGEDTVAQSTSPSPSTSLTTTQALCLHLRDVLIPREDAYTRLADTLKADAVAIKAEGDTELTAAVLRMRKAVLVYRDALATQGDTTAAAAGMADALDAMPC